ncbi:MAG: hypothetical protein QOJ29_5110, partial [Thermoleophilaceae bacterium]|nr:hypothetical protein [Thermoleophilaceae bacterium]
DRHVDVLVVGLDFEATVVDLCPDLVETTLELGQLLSFEDPHAAEHAGMRDRLIEVVRSQSVVETD